MKLTVHYEYYDHSFFPAGYHGPTFIKFANPPFVPSTGDKVHLRLEEFMDDPFILKTFSEQTEGKVYYAERLHTFIGKEETEAIIILHEETEFRKSFPAFLQTE